MAEFIPVATSSIGSSQPRQVGSGQVWRRTPRPACDGTPPTSVRPGRCQARHANILQTVLRLAIAQADVGTAMTISIR